MWTVYVRGKNGSNTVCQRKKTELNNKWNCQKKSFYVIIFIFSTLVCMLTVFFCGCECVPGWMLYCAVLLFHLLMHYMDVGWYILPSENNNVFRCATAAAAAAYHYCCNNCADVMSILSLLLLTLSHSLSFYNHRISAFFIADVVVTFYSFFFFSLNHNFSLFSRCRSHSEFTSNYWKLSHNKKSFQFIKS